MASSIRKALFDRWQKSSKVITMFHEVNHPGVKNIIDIMRRQRKAILVIPLVVIALGALFLVFCPRTYQSEARLLLRVGRESVGIDPAATTGQTMQLYTADRKDEVKSTQDVFQSQSVVSQVVDRLGIDVVLGKDGGGDRNIVAKLIGLPIGLVSSMLDGLDPVSEREQAINHVMRHLKVTAEPQAAIVVVKYRASTPQLAHEVCQTVVDVGREHHMRVYRSEQSPSFFTEQQERLREQLDSALESLRNAKDKMGLASTEQRRVTLEAQFSAIGLDRLTTNQELATSEARLADLNTQLDAIPERLISSRRSVPNQGRDLMRDQLFGLQVKSMELQARYSDTHPMVLAVKDQLKEAEKVLAEQANERVETTNDINHVYRELSLEMKKEQSIVAGLKARLVELDQQKEGVLAELRTVNGHDLEIDQLTRAADLAREKYLQYARTMEEARMDRELASAEISSIGLVQSATISEKPIVPSRRITAAGTLLLAFVGTFFVVQFRELKTPPTGTDDDAAAHRLRRDRDAHPELVANGNSDAKRDERALVTN